jgi:hypothetical protein
LEEVSNSRCRLSLLHDEEVRQTCHRAKTMTSARPTLQPTIEPYIAKYGVANLQSGFEMLKSRLFIGPSHACDRSVVLLEKLLFSNAGSGQPRTKQCGMNNMLYEMLASKMFLMPSTSPSPGRRPSTSSPITTSSPRLRRV